MTDGAICLGQAGVLGARGLISPLVVYCSAGEVSAFESV